MQINVQGLNLDAPRPATVVKPGVIPQAAPSRTFQRSSLQLARVHLPYIPEQRQADAVSMRELPGQSLDAFGPPAKVSQDAAESAPATEEAAQPEAVVVMERRTAPSVLREFSADTEERLIAMELAVDALKLRVEALEEALEKEEEMPE